MLSLDALQEAEKSSLLGMAKQALYFAVHEGYACPVVVDGIPERLLRKQASFVTLHLDNKLRGCIGSLEAVQPLVHDVVHNTTQASLHDPRFAPVNPNELPNIHLSLSLLTSPSELYFDSEQDLLAQIQPNLDGLILSDNYHRGTFLPSVWQQLPNKNDFLLHLKQKAGLPGDYWSDSLQVWRYTTETIE